VCESESYVIVAELFDLTWGKKIGFSNGSINTVTEERENRTALAVVPLLRERQVVWMCFLFDVCIRFGGWRI
jgi:hypothetical protein